MARRLLIVFLAVGVIGGYGAALAHVGGHRCWHHAAWQERVADVCVRAAERAWATPGAGQRPANSAAIPPPAPPPPPPAPPEAP